DRGRTGAVLETGRDRNPAAPRDTRQERYRLAPPLCAPFEAAPVREPETAGRPESPPAAACCQAARSEPTRQYRRLSAPAHRLGKGSAVGWRIRSPKAHDKGTR